MPRMRSAAAVSNQVVSSADNHEPEARFAGLAGFFGGARDRYATQMICLQYRKWISSLGCCIDSCPLSERSGMDAAHTGARGLGQKSSDFSTIPLCRRHHQEFDSNPKAFALKYKIDIPDLVEALNSMGFPGLRMHRPARKVVGPQFIRTSCICGWKSGWFRSLQDAQGSLHSHLEDQDKLARAGASESVSVGRCG